MKNVEDINELWKRLITIYDETYVSQEDGNIKKLYTFIKNIQLKKDIWWFYKNYEFNQRSDEIRR